MKKSDRDKLHEDFLIRAQDFGLEPDVISDGPIQAEIAVVGEGLGETEVKQGMTFCGGSGSLMWNALRRYDLHRANLYVSNVVKRQISLSRKDDVRHMVRPDELQRWTALLLWELEQLPNLRIIFVLGNFALKALTRNEGITGWRGSVVDCKLPNGREVKLVIAFNPAYVLREPKFEPMFLMDCQKLSRVVGGTWKEHYVETEINPSFSRALDFIEECKRSEKPVAFDIEVINMETACWGIGNSPNHAMCINLRDHIGHRYTIQEEMDLRLEIDQLVRYQQIIAQNGNFDTYWSWYKDGIKPKIWFDTMLAHHTLYPQWPHSLAFLVTQYTTHPYYKDEGKFWKEGGDIEQFWQYNCKDVALTWSVHQQLKKELHEQGFDELFYNHVMRLLPHLVRSTVEGLKVDLFSKQQAIEETSEEVERLKAEFYNFVHEATKRDDYFPNPNSAPQMEDLFFNKLKLRGRGRSTDEANRKKMANDPGTPPIAKEMLTTLDKYKKADKFLSTYAESRVDPDGRFRCDWKQHGVVAAPGRLSSSMTLWGTGMNLQNQPGRARRQFIADEGTVFIYFDGSQVEARIVAWRARIEKWKEQFERARIDGNYDAHRALASDMFNVPYDQVPKADFKDEAGRYPDDEGFDWNTASPTIRYIAKRCRHGLNYRMEEAKLAEVTGLSFYKARQAYQLYHRATPEIKAWWKQEERTYKTEKALYNAFGRRLKLIQRMDDSAFDSIIAFYPQSTNGDKVKQVWYKCMEDDEWPKGQAVIRINVHDALVGLATEKVAKTALKIMKKHQESPIRIIDAWGGDAGPLIVPAELGMSVEDEGFHRWSSIKKIKLD